MKKLTTVLLASTLLLGACGQQQDQDKPKENKTEVKSKNKDAKKQYQNSINKLVSKDADVLEKFKQTLKNENSSPQDSINEFKNLTNDLDSNRENFHKETNNFDTPKEYKDIEKSLTYSNKYLSDSYSKMAQLLQDSLDNKITDAEFEDKLYNTQEEYQEKLKKVEPNKDELKKLIKKENVDKYYNALDDSEESTQNEETSNNVDINNIQDRNTLESVIYGSYSETDKIQAYNSAVANNVIPQANVMSGPASAAYESSLAVEKGEDDSVYDHKKEGPRSLREIKEQTGKSPREFTEAEMAEAQAYADAH